MLTKNSGRRESAREKSDRRRAESEQLAAWTPDGPVHTPPPAVETLEPERLLQWEIRRGRSAAAGFDMRLRASIASRGEALSYTDVRDERGRDGILLCIPLFLLRCYVEARFVARARWPDLEALWDAEDSSCEEWPPSADDLAVDVTGDRLTVNRQPGPKPKPLPADLPGCQTTLPDGDPCPKLRRKGDRFCPACARTELARMRRGG